MEESRQLFLIMSSNNENRYCLYRIREPSCAPDIGDEMTIINLEEPLLGLEKSVFSDSVSFAAVGSRIFIVGGHSYDDKEEVQASKNVSIYDTETSKLTRGPSLKQGKMSPHLFTLGSKLFALSNVIYSDDIKSMSGKRKIVFEVLDVSNLEKGWSRLPIPILRVSRFTPRLRYTADAFVAMFLEGGSSSGVIFLTVSHAGTYIFDIAKQTWDFVNDDALPFSGQGSTIPHAPSLCCGISIKSRVFCSFRFRYGGDEEETTKGLQIHETKIDDPYSLSPLLPPFLCCYRPEKMVQGLNGRFYFVGSGVDRHGVLNTLVGNRYVKIRAYEFSNIRLDGEEGQCPKRCKTKNWLMRHKEEVESQLKLTALWRRSFFGGPVCVPLLHVKAAFAM